jgi:hypothetical protein
VSAKKLGLIAALTAAGAVAVGGAALANAATDTSPSPSSSSSSSSNGTTDGTEKGSGRGGGNHTPVTGDEAAKVTAAVKAKDSAVTVSSVRKDPDGSYDVLGTTSGNPVMYDVSADLLTITESAGRGGHGDGVRRPSGTGAKIASPSASPTT